MNAKNVLYAQSGGPTAVINTTAAAVIETAASYPDKMGKVFAARNGIIGALNEELIDTSLEAPEAITGLKQTPASAFGSCRYKLKSLEENRAEYERLIAVLKAHDIGYFFYNGGGDSQDTSHKISQIGDSLGYPITCIGIPKTIDNDLPHTDSCPGFGSVAKYVATSVREAALDVASMCTSSTKVFILEVMGRHTGWIAAASGLAAQTDLPVPHAILFPEIPYDEAALHQIVNTAVERDGYCVIVASEGIRTTDGKFLVDAGHKDAFGHAQLGGVAPMLAESIKTKHGHKYHWAVADYLQRAARHIASATDHEQAYALGQAAVELALAGQNNIMVTINRLADAPYQWEIGTTPLSSVANVERTLPRNFITDDGFGITPACRRYLLPLIQGEAYPSYVDGLPNYVRLKQELAPQRL